MTTASTASARHEPGLAGQRVVVVGGSSGIGLETARHARAEGAEVVLTGRNREKLDKAAAEVGASDSAAFDATDPKALKSFFDGVPAPIDHIMVTAGHPNYGPLLDMDADEVRDSLSDHLVLALEVARGTLGKINPGGTMLFMGSTGAKRVEKDSGISSAAAAALAPFAAALALELAPVRVNLINAGFVDTPLSASLLKDQLDERRGQLRSTLPIARVVTADDIADLAVDLMANTAVTGAAFDIDGGQQFVS